MFAECGSMSGSDDLFPEVLGLCAEPEAGIQRVGVDKRNLFLRAGALAGSPEGVGESGDFGGSRLALVGDVGSMATALIEGGGFFAFLVLFAAVMEAVGMGKPVLLAHPFEDPAQAGVLEVELGESDSEQVLDGAAKEDAVHAFARDVNAEQEREAGESWEFVISENEIFGSERELAGQRARNSRQSAVCPWLQRKAVSGSEPPLTHG